MRRLARELRAIDPRVGDGLLAAAAVAAMAIEVVIFADGDPADLAIGAVTAAGMATLALRRSAPVVPAVVVGATSLLAALAAPDVYTNVTTTFVAMMIALYAIGRYGGSIRWGVAVIVSIGIGTVATDSLTSAPQILWLGVLGGGPLAIGRVTRSRKRLQAQLRESTLELERDRARRSQTAIEDERARLAGELQAVIANGVSAIVLQAEAVPRVIDAGDPARADLALAEVEHTGRETLAETRRLLGILRRDGDGRALAPQPTMAEAAALVDHLRGEGLEVDLSVEGEHRRVAAGPDLAAYRVLQQALEAAASAGARRADVRIRYELGELELEVSDDRRDPEIDPERLLAMRERLGLYGGRVRAGLEGERAGFRLSARLPLSEVGP